MTDTTKPEPSAEDRKLAGEIAEAVTPVFESDPVTSVQRAVNRARILPLIAADRAERERYYHEREFRLRQEADNAGKSALRAAEERATKAEGERDHWKAETIEQCRIAGRAHQAEADLQTDLAAAQGLLYRAWTVIANASGGNWKLETPEWQRAATKWRDDWHARLDAAPKVRATICDECGSGLLDGQHIADYSCSKREPKPPAILAPERTPDSEVARAIPGDILGSGAKLNDGCPRCGAAASLMAVDPGAKPMEPGHTVHRCGVCGTEVEKLAPERSGSQRPTCSFCSDPATCFGHYEGVEEDEAGKPDFGCDEHCGHGNEDGWCKPIAEYKPESDPAHVPAPSAMPARTVTVIAGGVPVPPAPWRQYRRSQIAELRPFVVGETLSDRVSISAPDREAGSPKPGDMIARNPKNHEDQWLVAAGYFRDNFEPAAPPLPDSPEQDAAYCNVPLPNNPGHSCAPRPRGRVGSGYCSRQSGRDWSCLSRGPTS